MAEHAILLSDAVADGRAAIEEIVAAAARGRPDAAVIGRAIDMLGDAAAHDLRDACDQDLVALLVEGWSKAKDIRDYGDPARHPAPSKATLALGKHAVDVAIDPQLTLVIGPGVRFPLKFVAVFAVTIEAARLSIVGGAIAAVDLGSLTLSAKLRWGASEVPLPLKSHEIALPGHFPIAPPFAIRH